MKRKLLYFSLLTTLVTLVSQVSFMHDGSGATYYCINDTCRSEQIRYNRRIIGIRTSSIVEAPNLEEKFFENFMWGYVDAAGKVVIAPKYSFVHLFQEGYAAVAGIPYHDGCTTNQRMFHIRLDGSPLYSQRFNQVSDFVNNYAWVEEKGKYDMYHIDTKGSRLYPQTYCYVYPFNIKGYALVEKETIFSQSGELWVIINTKGNELVKVRGEYKDAILYFKKLGYLN